MWTFIILIALVVGALLVPPRWDPAVRLKEWTERGRR